MALEPIGNALGRMDSVIRDYESPAEESLGERLRSALASSAIFETQVEVATSIQGFRLDMLLISPARRRIAVEVDGKDFHDPNRDFWRTVFLVAERKVDVVYRVPATYVKRNLIGVLAALASLEAGCFDTETATQWRQAAERSYVFDRDDDHEDYLGRSAGGVRESDLILFGLRNDAFDSRPANVAPYYQFAKGSGLTSLDAIRSEWKRQHPPASPVLQDNDFDWFGSLE